MKNIKFSFQKIKFILPAITVITLLSGSTQNFPLVSQRSMVTPTGEVDPESGAVTYLLGGDERPADNIYGEQPYGDASGRRIAVRYFSTGDKTGGISIIDLIDGSRHEILKGDPPFPAFHAWGKYLFYNEKVGEKLILRPYTPRPTGHEAWIGNTGTIFYSTDIDKGSFGNIWTASVSDPGSKKVYEGKLRFGHISVSHCGRYWIGDTGEKDIPIYIGSFATGKCKRVVFSRTEYDNKQWSHAHPYLTADNKWLIYSARRNGHPQVFGAKLKEG
jgi:hypothetical protein